MGTAFSLSLTFAISKSLPLYSLISCFVPYGPHSFALFGESGLGVGRGDLLPLLMRLQTRINSAVGKGLVEEGGICVNEFGINVRQVILTVHTGSVFRRFSKFFFFLFMERPICNTDQLFRLQIYKKASRPVVGNEQKLA